MGGKVSGVVSAAIENLEQQKATLLQAALDGLIDYYSAPDGAAGDAQRQQADKDVQDAWRRGHGIAERVAGIKDLKADAIKCKNDLGRWLKIID